MPLSESSNHTLMTSKLIAKVLVFILQELLWRTRAFSQHFDQWTRQGYEFDETLKTEALKPAQEALMKLFAVSLERNEPRCENRSSGFPTRSDTNRVVQSHKMGRVLKFWI